MDLILKFKSSDNFETALLTDNSNRTVMLKRASAANGVLMPDDEGVSIHFKSGEGLVGFVKDRPIPIQEFKE
ncbi:hypothetical protein NI467_12950 [Acinetobacter bohemicus]|uniref:hypothetical protein n=1 Tax=Acinetobacter sp. S4397-1 TaxID=2972915 RepID=UPI00209BA08A|nr:hypothetical protein [Acinetobacter sp. S4397-1]MCO8046234.1 hypothetical protein [Acinetobacter sp. S4397-1]